MAVQMPGVRIPTGVPMTNAQYRAHKALGAAEKRLVHAYMFGHSPEKIARQEATVRRLTTAWQKSCPVMGQR